jgi:hypothetical protein
LAISHFGILAIRVIEELGVAGFRGFNETVRFDFARTFNGSVAPTVVKHLLTFPADGRTRCLGPTAI